MEIVQSFSLWFLYVHVVVWGYGWCVSKVEMCNNFKVYCNCGAVFIWRMMGSGIGRVVKWEEQGAPHQCQVCKSSQSYPKQYSVFCKTRKIFSVLLEPRFLIKD